MTDASEVATVIHVPDANRVRIIPTDKNLAENRIPRNISADVARDNSLIVVNTNVIAYLLLGGEKTAKARAAYLKDPVWAAPILWRSEFRNVLAMYLRRGELEMGDALELTREGESLLEGEEYQVESDQVLRLVCSSRCSAHDCEFVALAKELGVSLVTGDKRLAAEFPDMVVALDDFVSD